MIKVLVIDDEPLALQQLGRMVEKTPYMRLVAACESAFEAIEVLQKENVDAIFTDINMPDLSGLDFVRTLKDAPIVVFTTAYGQYALDGYRVNAIDYLMKPFGQAEFQRAAAKVKRQCDLLRASRKPQSGVLDGDAERLEGDVLFVKDGYDIVRISVSEIIYVESQSEYLKIYMKGGDSHMALMSIKRMSELLPQNAFLRIHRSYIVNMKQILNISRLRISMGNGVLLPIGDSYKEQVLKYINDRMIGK